MTVSATILHLTVCISDIIKKASRCGKNIQHVMSQPFCVLFFGREPANMGVPQGAQISSTKKKEYLFCINISKPTK